MDQGDVAQLLTWQRRSASWGDHVPFAEETIHRQALCASKVFHVVIVLLSVQSSSLE